MTGVVSVPKYSLLLSQQEVLCSYHSLNMVYDMRSLNYPSVSSLHCTYWTYCMRTLCAPNSLYELIVSMNSVSSMAWVSIMMYIASIAWKTSITGNVSITYVAFKFQVS